MIRKTIEHELSPNRSVAAVGGIEAARDGVLLVAQAEPHSDLGQALRDVANRVQSEGFDKLLGQLLSERSSLNLVLEPGHGLDAAQALLRHQLAIAEHESPASITSARTG